MIPAQLETKEEAEQVSGSKFHFFFPSQAAWHLFQLRPKRKQSSLKFAWWLGLTDTEKEGEFRWTLNHDQTLWEDVTMEDGSSHPSCATMDADLTLSGVDCAVEKTDTATRTILCEAGGKSAGLYVQLQPI